MASLSRPQGFLRIAGLMAVVVAALVLLTREGLVTLSAIRAFSSGAAHWVHAEKEVIHHLGRYVRSPNRTDWAIYSSYIEVLHANRAAIAMARDFDADDGDFFEVAQRMGHTLEDTELLAGTQEAVWRLSPIRKPLEIWFASDTLVAGIEEVARQVGPPDAATRLGAGYDTTAALARLGELDVAADQTLDRFTTELSRADHLTRRLILLLVGISGLVLLAGALWITHRTLQDVARSEEARERTEARLQILLKQTPIVVWTVDRDMVVRTIEGSDQAIWERLRGMKLQDVLDSTTRNDHALRAHRAALKGSSSDYDTIWGNRTFTVHVEPLREPDGRIVGAVGVALDVTSRAEIERERSRLEEQFREAQKMEAVGRLAGGIAHDFNNLLTVIRGNTSLLQIEAKETSEELAEIDRAAEKARQLTRQLLAYSRREPSRPRVMKPDELISGMRPMLRSVMGEAVTLSLELNEDAGPVKADPGQLEQVILNLALNARDAMPDGGEFRISSRHVTTRGGEPIAGGPADVPRGDYVHLKVTDDGHGIDEEHLPRIFEPFYSTKDPAEGSGLGLAMVYGVVKQADGFVWAESAPGEGTTIHILLPRAEGEVEEGKPARKGESPALVGAGSAHSSESP